MAEELKLNEEIRYNQVDSSPIAHSSTLEYMRGKYTSRMSVADELEANFNRERKPYKLFKRYTLGVTQVGEQISDYDSKLLNSPWKICMCFPGSFCYYLGHQKGLLLEEVGYAIIFFLIVFLTTYNDYNFIPKVIVETNSMDTILAFLLGLYVSINIARWWRLRTDGIGNIWSATSGIATLLGAAYKIYKKKIEKKYNIRFIHPNDDRESKKDEQRKEDDSKNNIIDDDLGKDIKKLKDILTHYNKVQNLCEASLALVFLKHEQDQFSWDKLEEHRILTKELRKDLDDTEYKKKYKKILDKARLERKNIGEYKKELSEIEILKPKIPGSHAEYVWALVLEELLTLKMDHEELFDYNGSMELSLQSQVLKGRSGAGLIGSQMGTQLPLTYVHGVTLMGKVYNFILCITSAIEFVQYWIVDLKQANPDKYDGLSNKEVIDEAPVIFTWNVIISLFFLWAKTISISMLLILCEKISNPFNDDMVSYPGTRYVRGIGLDFEILLGFDIQNEEGKIKNPQKNHQKT